MNEESIFAAALDLLDPSERQAFLDEACSGDGGLRLRLDRLLAEGERPDGILDRVPAVEAPSLGGIFAGRFKLRQKLGEGGMGEVWVADQFEPVRRRVAIKMIRAGLDSSRLLARFDQERQALAMMDHPNVARALDAGLHAGQPYFVMELIKGVPITEYCDVARLSLRQRLELFIPVCNAVQHAHQKGIIHRDLKPSNILVALFDGKPVPKVIDFGVAKATGPRLSAESIYTEVGALIGTVEYMSPEQAELNNLDVDTRSDVYALGVLLYELVTGSVPFPRRQLQAATFVEMLRIIKEDEPPMPSTRLSSAETPIDVAAVRQTPPGKLASTVRGELDWIVMKCLEKNRSRRYETANELANDIQRFLVEEPVHAGPPTARYRLRKLYRRNRGTVLAAGLLLLALVGGIIGITFGLVRAERARANERQRAEGERAAKEDADRRAEGERAAKEESQSRLKQIEKSIDILLIVFRNLGPRASELDGKPLLAILGDRCVAAADALDAESVGDPLLLAKLQHRLGEALMRLQRVDKAIEVMKESLAIRTTHLGPDHDDTLETAGTLALALSMGKEPTAAVRLFEETRQRRRNKFGDDHAATIEATSQLASLYWSMHKPKLALPLQEDLVVSLRRTAQKDKLKLVSPLRQLGIYYCDCQKPGKGLAALQESLALSQVLFAPDAPITLGIMERIANAHRLLHDADAEMETLEQRLRLLQAKKDGARQSDTLRAMEHLGSVYLAHKKTDKALNLLEEALALRRQLYPTSPQPDKVRAMFVLGGVYRSNGKSEKALQMLEEAAQGVEALRFQHPDAHPILLQFCRALEDSGRHDRAEPWRRKCLAVVKRHDGLQWPAHAQAYRDLGLNQFAQQKRPQAAESFLKAREILLATTAEALAQAPRRALMEQVCHCLAKCYDAMSKPDEAAKWRREAEAIRAEPKPK